MNPADVQRVSDQILAKSLSNNNNNNHRNHHLTEDSPSFGLMNSPPSVLDENQFSH